MKVDLKKTFQNFLRFIQVLPAVEKLTLLDLIKEVEELIDQTETQPIRFSSNSSSFDQQAILDHAEIAELLSDKIDDVSLKNRLLWKSNSLKYRVEGVNGGNDPVAIQPSLVAILKKIVTEWKEGNDLIENKTLLESELLQLQITSQYPEIVWYIVNDQDIRNKFISWVVRDGNSAKIFIEFPQLCQKLTDSNLSGRIGRINPEHLKIQKIASSEGNVQEKIVSLPFDGIDHSILDAEHIICFKGNFFLSVGEIFKVFADKNVKVGDLEYLAFGISNWNCHNWGHWDADKSEYQTINLNHQQWWKQLPIFEIISQGEAKNRYGIPLDGKSWCIAATATRGSATLDFENTHAFFEVAVPWGNGSYAVYDFGKFARKFPASFFEGISIFCHNLHATVAYPDENVFYSHRQQMYHAYAVDAEKGVALMALIKKDMIKGLQKNFVYQIESDNCAKWVHEHLEATVGVENVPNMFLMHLLDTEPQGLTSGIFNLIKKLPKCLQTPVMTFCHLPMGAWKKTWIIENGKHVCKSLTKHDFWLTGEVYLPALLLKKLETKSLTAVLALTETVTNSYQMFTINKTYYFFATVYERILADFSQAVWQGNCCECAPS